jgi:hypothetical protein
LLYVTATEHSGNVEVDSVNIEEQYLQLEHGGQVVVRHRHRTFRER